MTDRVPQPTNWRIGDRVEWGERETAIGVLVARAVDEDTGEPETCGDDHDGDGSAPLWRIRFETGSLAGREKRRCCERSIIRRVS
jgi:hypothetical protein